MSESCCVPIIGGRTPTPGGGGGPVLALGLEEYTTDQDDSVFSTSSAAFVSTGKSLVTPVLSGGTYRLGMYHVIGPAGVSGSGRWNCDLDGGGFVWPTDLGGGFDDVDIRENNYRSRVLALGAGAHTFTLQSRRISGTVRTGTTYFELWKQPPSLAGTPIDPCVCAEQDITQTFTATGRTLTTRTLVTPVVSAGTYRIRADYLYTRTGGSACEFNIDLDGLGDIFPRFTVERPFVTRETARTLLREVVLGAGAHTFTLSVSTTSSTSYFLGQTSWYFHRIA